MRFPQINHLYSVEERREAERVKKILAPLVKAGTLSSLKRVDKAIEELASFWRAGAYKIVHVHSRIPTLLIKRWENLASRKCEGWLEPIPKYAREFFLHPIIINNVYLIQKRANCIGGNCLQAALHINKELSKHKDYKGVGDICDANCAYHNGKPYFFDYIMGVEMS